MLVQLIESSAYLRKKAIIFFVRHFNFRCYASKILALRSNAVRSLVFHVYSQYGEEFCSMSRTVAVSLRVAVHFPRKVMRKRGNVHENLTVIVFCNVTLLQENI